MPPESTLASSPCFLSSLTASLERLPVSSLRVSSVTPNNSCRQMFTQEMRRDGPAPSRGCSAAAE